MVRQSIVLAVMVWVAGSLGAAGHPFDGPAVAKPECPIDELVFGRWQQLKIQPANLCSDAVFLRRVHLDVIGTLPTAAEAREFLNNTSTKKRAALIEKLLARPEFAEYWALKWSDLLRIKAEFPINLWPNAAQAYHRYVFAAVRENKPYDRFVRELLTDSGSNFRVPQVNFYRAMQNRTPEGIAQTVALTFMGTRADKWPKEQLAGMAGFFSHLSYKSTAEWKEEIVYFDPGKSNAAATATFPGGAMVQLSPDKDPREVFADWLIQPGNQWFARNIANRAWSWLCGRGIVHEPDDIRADNPPSNPALLAYLERELIAARYDLKQLFRLILNSQVYQLSPVPRSKDPAAAANFAYYPLRRLEAEVLVDALCQITGTTERYSSAIPEPFTYIPEEQRSIELPDGSITSSFLELFGRPPRDTGLESERNNKVSPAQALHMLNSSHIQRKLEQGRKLQSLLNGRSSPRDTATTLYLTFLSRYPTDDELQTIAAYADSATVKREAALDLVWSLVNSAEFLYRH